MKELWDVGIETYNASSRQNFQLHAALLWSINDFPAYGILFGWSTKGALACSCCHVETNSYHLKYGHKHCYMGHRRFLPIEHPWRKNKSSFDNTRDVRFAPQPLSGDDAIAQLGNFQPVTFGKATKKRKRNEEEHHNIGRKRVFSLNCLIGGQFY